MRENSSSSSEAARHLQEVILNFLPIFLIVFFLIPKKERTTLRRCLKGRGERKKVNGCSFCGVYGNLAFHCVKRYNNKYSTCSDLWTSIYSLLTETHKISNSTLLTGTPSESLMSFCDAIRWIVSPLHGMMHISQSMELRHNSPLPVATGPKCQRCLRFCDTLNNAEKQLCDPCNQYRTNVNNWISLRTKYLPKMIEEDSNRKPVTWTFYCGRVSGFDVAMDEDHFITLKESFLNSVR